MHPVHGHVGLEVPEGVARLRVALVGVGHEDLVDGVGQFSGQDVESQGRRLELVSVVGDRVRVEEIDRNAGELHVWLGCSGWLEREMKPSMDNLDIR